MVEGVKELESRIHDENNGLDYEMVGDYYIPALELPEEHRTIGRWGRLHKSYLEETQPGIISRLGGVWKAQDTVCRP